jgi:hypothetical protein
MAEAIGRRGRRSSTSRQQLHRDDSHGSDAATRPWVFPRVRSRSRPHSRAPER